MIGKTVPGEASIPRDDARRPVRRAREGAVEPAHMLVLARLTLLWERLWAALWPASGIAGLLVALALFNVLPGLPGWLHLLALAGLLGAIGWTAHRGLRGFLVPGVPEARRRLERDSDLAHRPLEALADRLAAGRDDPASQGLWLAAQRRARAQVSALRLRLPNPGLVSRDPFALRGLVGLLLVLGVVVAGPDWAGRLGAALTPRVGAGGAAPGPGLDVWVTPPAYTRLPPVFLTGASRTAPRDPAAPGTEPAESDPDAPLAVPDGSVVTARLTGGAAVPQLDANGEDQRFTQTAQGTYQIEQAITQGSRLAVRYAGRELLSVPIRVVPDGKPGIAFRTPPSVTERQAVRLDYTAADDYGITKVEATVTLKAEVPAHIDRTPITLPVPLPRNAPKEVNGTGFQDMTHLTWAGLPVSIRLTATDGAGHSASSDEQQIVLPEREFTNPVARQLIVARKDLLARGEEAREDVGRVIHEVSLRPDAFGGDLAAFLALRSAFGRLAFDRTPDALDQVQGVLWDVALRIEDGGVAIAERDLRDAQQRLMDALDSNAPDEQVQQLMADLRQAMDRFLDAMERQAQQAADQGPAPPAGPNERVLDRQDLQEMLDKMQQAAQTGSRDAARQMLSQLREMMEGLKTEKPGENEAQAQLMEQMKQLEALAQRQRELLDESFRQSRPEQNQSERKDPQAGEDEQQKKANDRMSARSNKDQKDSNQTGQAEKNAGNARPPAEQASQQDMLRKQLGEIMQHLGAQGGGANVPTPLTRADRAMKDAGEALRRGAPGQAVKPQSEAVDALNNGLQDMAQQARQASARRSGNSPNGREPMRDPLGRPVPGNGSGSPEDVKIPEEADLQRAREIQDELRRRSGDPDRPRLERDYIDRLLRQF